MIAHDLLKDAQTTLEDGRIVHTALVDMKLHDEVWGLYANLAHNSGESENVVEGVIDIIEWVERYPAIDGRYVELADAYDIFRDVLAAIHNDDFGTDWDYACIENPLDEGFLDDESFLTVLVEGIRLIGNRLNMNTEAIEEDIAIWD